MCTDRYRTAIHMPVRRRRNAARRRRGGKKLGKRQVATVKKLIARRQELKYRDYGGSYAPTTTGVMYQITTIPQGDTDITRDGDRLYLKKIYMRGELMANTDTYNFVRLILFQWKPTVSPATVSEILLDGPSGSPDTLSHYSHDHRQNYRILYDKVMKVIGPASAAATPNTAATVRNFAGVIYPKLHQLQYLGGTTNGTSQVYMLIISDSNVVPHPTLNLNFKMMFTDS